MPLAFPLASPPPSRPLRLAAVAFLALQCALSGCGSPRAATDKGMTAAIATPVTEADFQQAATYWGTRYASDPNDRSNALNHAAALGRAGQTAEAVSVLAKATRHAPADREILAAYGRSLAADGQLEPALVAVRRAEALSPAEPDWKLISAEGTILDQLGQPDEARKLYAKALALQPGDPTVLSNLGISYVLTNDLPEAEKMLRLAVAQPGADGRVRENLALVVSLQGRFVEAQQIAGADFSPVAAEANVAKLQAMLEKSRAQRASGSAVDKAGPVRSAPVAGTGTG